MDIKSKFKAAMAEAMKNASKTGVGSVEIPAGYAGDVQDLLSELLGGDEEKKPRDETPLAQTVIDSAVDVIHGLSKTSVPLEEYVRAFSYAIVLHAEIHNAPTFLVKLHEHTIAMGEAIHNIAIIRFGDKAFMEAVDKYQSTHIDKAKASLIDLVLEDAGDYFKSLRPKNKLN